MPRRQSSRQEPINSQVEDVKVNIRRLIVPMLLGVAVTTPIRPTSAQQLGTLELGGFLQLDRVAKAVVAANEDAPAGDG